MWVSLIFFIVIVLIAIFLAPILRKSIDGEKTEYLPYIKKDFLMTKAEHEFFKVLQQAVQDKYYIVPQVQLSNLVKPEKGKERDYAIRNKIDRKSVDFVLFNKEYFTPHLVIELDDSSHARENRQVRDSFVDRVLHRTGIKIVHVKNSYNYDLKEITDFILQN